MRDPDSWVGAWPTDAFWTQDGVLHFSWNPKGVFEEDSLFRVTAGGTPEKLSLEQRMDMAPRFTGWGHGSFAFDPEVRNRVYALQGDLFMYDLKTGTKRKLTHTNVAENEPRFTPEGDAVIYRSRDNLFKRDLETGAVDQLTRLRSGSATDKDGEDDEKDFLESQQEVLFQVLQNRQERRERREDAREREREARMDVPSLYYGTGRVVDVQIDPMERFVSVIVARGNGNGNGTGRTSVQNYVTESGYAEALGARPKVGTDAGEVDLLIQDLMRDSVFTVDFADLPGAYDIPAYLVEQGRQVDSTKARVLLPRGIYWSPDGSAAVAVVRAFDNKDRWIVRIEPSDGSMRVLDRQHDDAWIAGPGIGWSLGPGDVGWMTDGRFYFQSERTGYSHLYAVDLKTGVVDALTSGDFAVFSPRLNRDGTEWLFSSNEGSPFERHTYRMPANGGQRTRVTTMPGRNDTVFGPDDRTMGILQSYSNKPPEIYIQEMARRLGRVSSEPKRVTFSPTDEWLSYPWRDPEVITFAASDGESVPARLYEPETPNGAAVLFVHGAGYLQNVHRWWSSYFREYMFHNLLCDLGYVVLDVDYRASEGYGRDWRTAIYRHMGGRDLQDYVDASAYLQTRYRIPAERIGIYGGSYGGFITLMALFTEADSFGAGAALRSVTDWAHYNHPYTSNILNTPETDSIAYVRSSPIYFAEGLEDPLLIAHGVVDMNVHFQDVVRLAQRLIELGKDDWEMALYPVEGHGFEEPTSWTDEYRRILELFEETIGEVDS